MKNRWEKTAERAHPELSNKIILMETASRFKFASNFVKDKIVLNAGCGTAYGLDYLSSARRIINIDISKDAINYARAKDFSTVTSDFLVMDVAEMGFKRGIFDVVISFEVIEHVKNYSKYLKEVYHVLKNGGLYIMSTPNKKTYSLGESRSENIFHVKEFTFIELKNVLERQFKKASIMGQKRGAGVTGGYSIVRHFLHRTRISNLLRRILNMRIRAKIARFLSLIMGAKKEIELTIDDFPIEVNSVEESDYFIAICTK